jgi:hypothetical protein
MSSLSPQALTWFKIAPVSVLMATMEGGQRSPEKKPVAGVIERHREIACGQPRSPFGDDLPRGSVNDSDLIGRGKIHINAVATRVNLEPFGVGGQGDIPSLLPSCGIERGQPPAAEPTTSRPAPSVRILSASSPSAIAPVGVRSAAWNRRTLPSPRLR